MLLLPQVIIQTFDKWAVNFMVPINPSSKESDAKYIITAMDYLTQWAEETPVKYYMTASAARFLFSNVVTRFGCQRVLLSGQGSHFINKPIEKMVKE